MAPHKSGAALAVLEARASGMRILLADDTEANRLLILGSLKRTQSTIDIAENGAMAVEMFQSGHYDLVLMDVEMPVMDGYLAAAEIRRFESETGAAPTPVVALTAHSAAEMAGTSGAGFTYLLTKPILNVALLETLARYRPAGRRIPVLPVPGGIPIDADIEIAAPAYLERQRAEVIVYRKALADGNFDEIKRLGHRMKGTGSGYGFPVLTELGSAIEQAALQADCGEVHETVNRFAHYLESVKP